MAVTAKRLFVKDPHAILGGPSCQLAFSSPSSQQKYGGFGFGGEDSGAKLALELHVANAAHLLTEIDFAASHFAVVPCLPSIC
jgi:hypothetical protein